MKKGAHVIADLKYTENYIVCSCGWKGRADPDSDFREHKHKTRYEPVEIVVAGFAPGNFQPAKRKNISLRPREMSEISSYLFDMRERYLNED